LAGESRLSLQRHGRMPARVFRHAIAVPDVTPRPVGRLCGLVEIAAGSGEAPQKWGQIHQMLRNEMSGFALALPFAVDAQQLGVQYFAALAHGYIEGCGTLLTPLERDNLVFAARLITGVMGLRFITDWLDGDRYYRVDHPVHNLERARNQFALFASLAERADSLQELLSP